MVNSRDPHDSSNLNQFRTALNPDSLFSTEFNSRIEKPSNKDPNKSETPKNGRTLTVKASFMAIGALAAAMATGSELRLGLGEETRAPGEWKRIPSDLSGTLSTLSN